MESIFNEESSDGTYVKWKNEISRYEKRFESWETKCKKIIQRYEDERGGIVDDRQSKFNSLWANIQTMLPSLYARLPNPQVDRRYKQQDDVGRITSEVLQRCIKFCLDGQNAHDKFRQSMLDYLLCARATLWVRYEPTIETKESELEDGGLDETLEWEDALIDYVHWRDFGHTDGKNWQEVDGVWRCTPLSRKQLIKRFGEEIGKEIPLNWSQRKQDEFYSTSSTSLISNDNDKALIYEIWDKSEKKVYWLCKDYKNILDERDDPLKLNGFFPCPKPLYATLTNEKMIPIPDYVEYQDQALELDDLTSRISSITKALKVAGVYDGSAQGIERLLNEGMENLLIPVESWSVFAEKGGLKGAMAFLPINEIAEVLGHLDQRRERVKADMYELIGISDLVRGNTNADETATAQGLKDKYLSVRFRDRRNEVNRFLRDTIQIMGEIISEHFNIETIIEMSAITLFMSQEEKQATQMQIQQSGQTPDDKTQEMLTNPTWQEVYALLKDNNARSFRIDIETDSVILADETQEKAERLEFLKAVSDFIEKTFLAAQQAPQLAPLLGSLLLFGIRSFKIGRGIEGEFEGAIEQLKKQAANPPPPQPNADLIKIQTENQFKTQELQAQNEAKIQQIERMSQLKLQEIMANLQAEREKNQMQMELKKNEQLYQAQQIEKEISLDSQRDQLNSQNEIALEQYKMQAEKERKEGDQRLKEVELQVKLLIAKLDAQTKIEVAEISAQSDLQISQTQAAMDAVNNSQEDIEQQSPQESSIEIMEVK